LTRKRSSIVAVNNSVGIEHWDDFYDELISKLLCLRFWPILKQSYDNKYWIMA
jgi:hypothetical protein